MNKRQ